MKKAALNILIFFSIVFIFVAAIHSGFLAFDGDLRPYLVWDHSGEMQGERLYWNDAYYVSCGGEDYHEGRTIAYTKGKSRYEINEVEGDEAHNFVVIRSFLDQYLLVREDYEIPTEGEITSVAWGHKVIMDQAFCSAFSALLVQISAGSCEKMGNLPKYPEKLYNFAVRIGFEDCPIATSSVGYLWDVAGTWYIAILDPIEESEDPMNRSDPVYAYYLVPPEYFTLFQQYSSQNEG